MQGRFSLLSVLVVLSTLLVTAGCQHRIAQTAPDVQIAVPFYPQERWQCGPAALASMLGYAGQDSSPDALVDEVWIPGRKGAITMELVAAARARGLLVYPVNSLRALREELDAGHPVLFQSNLLFNWWPQWHFAVVTGYGDGFFTLHSGERRHMRVSERWLTNHWAKADYTGYAVLPPRQLPATASASRLARTLAQMEHSAGSSHPHWWQAASERFPDSSQLYFGLGNARYSEGNAASAIAAFQDAVRVDPKMAAAWNNLAHLLWEQGDDKAAMAAIERALVLAPSNADYQSTREQILAR